MDDPSLPPPPPPSQATPTCGGGLMALDVGPLAALAALGRLRASSLARYWHVARAVGVDVVVLEHERGAGGVVVRLLDGTVVAERRDAIDAGAEFAFELAGGARARLSIVAFPGLARYDLEVDGVAVAHALSRAAPPLRATPSVRAWAVARRRPGGGGRADDRFAAEHGATGYFECATTLAAPRAAPRARAAWRRYSEFAALDLAVRAAFEGHHLRGHLPALPPRRSRLAIAHADEAFVEARRAALDRWLRALAQVPHVASAPPFLDFVGCTPDDARAALGEAMSAAAPAVTGTGAPVDDLG